MTDRARVWTRLTPSLSFPSMRGSIAGRVLVPLIGLWLMSNGGFFGVISPCPMHGVGSTHESMSMPASESHSHDAQHQHGSNKSASHGCDCAGRCGHQSQQFVLFDPVALPQGAGFSASVQPSYSQAGPLHGVRHLPFATGPPTRLHV
jgi:hypothetical protein